MLRTVFFMCLVFGCWAAKAQSWQWGQRGGGFSDGLNVLPLESVQDMDTDPNGNVYVLATVESGGFPTIGGQAIPRYGDRDIVVASFNCSGGLRWYKVIGGNNGDRGVAIRTDTLGHVYVAGSAVPYSLQFDVDSVQPANLNKSKFLVQYDTSGNFKWLRQPSADTAGFINSLIYTVIYDLHAEKNGETTMLMHLSPGLLSGTNNQVITTAGVYFVRYSVNGAFLGATPVQMGVMENPTSTYLMARFNDIRMQKTRTGNWLVNGSFDTGAPPFNMNFSLGGVLVSHSRFMACFKPNGQLFWVKEGTVTGGGFVGRAFVDSVNNITIAIVSARNKDTLNGYPLINSISTSSFPLVAKLDSLGNTIWIKASATNAATQASALQVNTKLKRVHLIGQYPGVLVWDSLRYSNPPNAGYDVFLTTFDAQTGAVLKIDSLESNFGYNDASTAMAIDKKGNLYLGGYMGGDLTINGTTLSSSGGTSDFFIAKYGSANCSNALPVTLTDFTGSKQGGANVLQWRTASESNNKGFALERATAAQGEYSSIAFVNSKATDGNSTAPLSYTYSDRTAATAGNCYYRLRQTDLDGRFTYSSVVYIKGEPVTTLALSALYPNPANQLLNVVIAAPATQQVQLIITDLAGRPVLQQRVQLQKGTNNHTINVTPLSPGSYVAKLLCKDGCERGIGKFVVLHGK